MTSGAGLTLGAGFICIGIALIDFALRRRKGAHSNHAF